MIRSLSRGSRLAAVTLALVLGSTAMAQPVFRPLNDFLSKQGTFPGSLFWPPVKNYLGWVDEQSTTFGIMDYAGLANDWLKTTSSGAIDLGTQVDGYVKEEMLPDGRGLVTVVTHT